MSEHPPSANQQLAALIANRRRQPISEEEPSEPIPTTPWLLARLSQMWFGLRAEDVREVVSPEAITRVPNQPGHFSGLTLIHGRLVPVLELAPLLRTITGREVPTPTSCRRFVVIARDEIEVALAADEARGVIHLEAPSETTTGLVVDDSSVIIGDVAWVDNQETDQLVCLLDTAHLLLAVAQTGQR